METILAALRETVPDLAERAETLELLEAFLAVPDPERRRAIRRFVLSLAPSDPEYRR